MKPDPLIRSARIALRPPFEGDVAAIAEACTDPEIGRYIPIMPRPYTVEDARAFVAAAREKSASGMGEELVIEDVANGELLGMIAVRTRDGESVGYWVRADARGRGIATEALTLAVRWARESHGVTRNWLTAHPQNRASQRVAEKAGFRRTAIVDHMPFADGEATAVRFDLPV
jgi:RimJ/RimL family protein N-acetyltransferase